MKINLNKSEGTFYVAEVGRTYATDNRKLYIMNRNRVLYYNKKQVIFKIRRGVIELRNISNHMYIACDTIITYDAFLRNFNNYKAMLHDRNNLLFHLVLVPKNKYEEFKKLIVEMGNVSNEVMFYNKLKDSVKVVRDNYKMAKSFNDKATVYKENAERCSRAVEENRKKVLKTSKEIIDFYGEDNIPDIIKGFMKEVVSQFEEEYDGEI